MTTTKGLVISIILLILISLQIKFHIEYKRLDILKSILKDFGKRTVITKNFQEKINLKNSCLNIEVVNDNLDNKNKFIEFLFTKILTEYSIHLLGSDRKKSESFLIHLFINTPRGNENISFEIVKNNNNYYFNDILNLCELMSDVNETYLYLESKECE